MSTIVDFPRPIIIIEVSDDDCEFGWRPRFLVTYRDQDGAENILWDGLSHSEAMKEAENLRADFGIISPVADGTAWCRQ